MNVRHLTLRLLLPIVALAVVALPAAAQTCHPSTTNWSFNTLTQGMTSQGTMWVYNNSDEVLNLEVRMEESPAFTLMGGTFVTIQPWDHYSLYIDFQPPSGGYFETLVTLGNELCEDILVSGTGLGISAVMDPPFVDFGGVDLGQSASRYVSLTNDGDVDLTIDATTLVPGLAVLGPSGNLAPGQTMDFELRYEPNGPGLFQGVVKWTYGFPSCGSLTVRGEGQVSMNPGENRVGLFFDPGYTELLHYNDGSAEFLTGYLVLTTPAPYQNLSGWELCPAVDGSATIYNWEIQGDFINAGTGKNLIIGLGGEPLPPSDAVLLATCQIYVAESVGETISVSLLPVATPTFPGLMAWQPVGEEAQVMLPFTGLESVAWIKTGAVAAVPDPEPQPELMPRPVAGLLANVPNPFNPATEVRFVTDADGPTRVRIFDLTGRLVRTLVNENLPAGEYGRQWNGRDDAGRQVASGAYYVRLEGRAVNDSRKILLLK